MQFVISGCSGATSTAQELLADMRSLAEERPALAKTYTIGNSVRGQDLQVFFKASQELQMLSTVTLYCQVTKIAMNSGSQLSEL